MPRAPRNRRDSLQRVGQSWETTQMESQVCSQHVRCGAQRMWIVGHLYARSQAERRRLFWPTANLFCRETTRMEAEMGGNRVPADCTSEACEVEGRVFWRILQMLHDWIIGWPGCRMCISTHLSGPGHFERLWFSAFFFYIWKNINLAGVLLRFLTVEAEPWEGPYLPIVHILSYTAHVRLLRYHPGHHHERIS